MTIFDSIKYPVPDDLIYLDNMVDLPNKISKKFLALQEKAILDGEIIPNDFHSARELLRKVILEWEDDDI